MQAEQETIMENATIPTPNQTAFRPKNPQVQRVVSALARCTRYGLTDNEQRVVSSLFGNMFKALGLDERGEIEPKARRSKDGDRLIGARVSSVSVKDSFILDLCDWEAGLRNFVKLCYGTIGTDWMGEFSDVPVPKTFKAWLEDYRRAPVEAEQTTV